jgi:hypothetical protein
LPLFASTFDAHYRSGRVDQLLKIKKAAAPGGEA